MKNIGFRTPANFDATVHYTTNLGRTGTVKVNNGDNVFPFKSDTEWITKIDLDILVTPGRQGQFIVTGTVNPDIPTTEDGATYESANLTSGSYKAGASPNWVRIQNCMVPGSKFASESGKEILSSRDSECGWGRVGQLRPELELNKRVAAGSPQTPGGNITFWLDISNPSPTVQSSPVVTDLLPCGLSYVEDSMKFVAQNHLTKQGMKLDSSKRVTDASGCSRQLLVLSWPGEKMIRGKTDIVAFDVKVAQDAKAGRYINEAQITPIGQEQPANGINYCGGRTTPVVDTLDLNGNGRKDDVFCQSKVEYQIIDSPSMSIVKEVKGSEDKDFLAGDQAVGTVDPGEGAEYRLTATNTGNVPLDKVVLYDVLPYPGDTGVGPSSGSPRGSQWHPFLREKVRLQNSTIDPKNVKIEYSTSPNACRGEVYSQGGQQSAAPSGCVNDWTETPASLEKVRAIRVEVRNTNLEPGKSVQVLVPMNAPSDAQGIAWNSVAMAGRTVNGSWLLPIEPIKVGLEVTVDLGLTKRIVDPQPAYGIGDIIHFQITARNFGPGDGTQIRVLDKLPDGLEFVRSETHLCTANGGPAPEPCQSDVSVGTYDSQKGTWNLFPDGQHVTKLSKDSTATIDVYAKLTGGAEGKNMSNHASIEYSGQKDGKTSNNQSEISFKILYSIAGTVYRDSDANATKSGTEQGFGGITVALLGKDGAEVATTTTADDGTYSFPKVSAGDYRVVVKKEGSAISSLAQTQDPDTAKDSETNVTVGPENPAVANLDFGYVATGSLGDRVWYDRDANGVQDNGEPGIAGVTVTLLDAAGSPVTHNARGKAITPVRTDKDGAYAFSDLLPGTYTVAFTPPAGMEATSTATGTDTTRDSNGTRAQATLTEGQTDNSIDLGLVGTGTIGDTIWLDSNHNGTPDPTEPGLAKVPVTITWAGPDATFGTDDDLTQTITTDTNGKYTATRLSPGKYKVEVQASDIEASSKKVGDHVAATLQTFAPDGKRTGGSIIDTENGGKFVLSSQLVLNGSKMSNDGQDFGFAVPVDLSLTKKIQGDEPKDGYVPGTQVTYKLTVTNDGPGTATGVTVTDHLPKGLEYVGTPGSSSYDPTSGKWTVGTLAPGARAELSVTAKVLASAAGGQLVNVAEVASADQKDVDSTPGNGKTGEDDIATANLTAGFTLAGNLYRDSDASFTKNTGEAPFANATITLTDATGTPIGQTTTDATGHYQFTGLASGTYTVTVTRTSEMTDLAITDTYDKSRKDTITATITTDSILDVNYGYLAPATIGDKVWNDLNANGVQDNGEPGIAGVTVTLLDAAGSPVTHNARGKAITPVRTDKDGAYAFSDLLPGTYTVAFTPPAGMEATSTATGTDTTRDSNGTRAQATLTEGQTDNSIDLGLVGTGTIGDTIWLDSNHNGTPDPTEPGLAKVPVTITWAGPDATFGTDDDLTQTITTDTNGKYTATRLSPGKYKVEVQASDIEASSKKVGDHVAATLQTFAPDGKRTGGSIIDTENGGKFVLSSQLVLNGSKMSNDGQDFGFAVPVDLSLTKKIQGDEPKDGYVPGTQVTYKLTVTNDGPGTATGVTVTDHLPKGLEYVGTPGSSSYDPTSGKWTVGTLAPGARAELSVTAKVLASAAGGQLVNVAEVASADQKDVDSTPGNGKTGEDDIATANLTAGFTLAGNLYRDSDASFTKNTGEAPFANATITLTDATGTPIGQTTTDATGHYQFTGLASGTYTVTVTRTSEMTDLAITDTYDKSRKDTITATITTDSILDVNYGYLAPATIGDKVWNDLNANGIQDNDEPGIAGVEVRIVDSNGKTVTNAFGKKIAPTKTDKDGAYTFTGLLPGTYKVIFDVPKGWHATESYADGDLEVDSNGPKAEVRVTEGQADKSVDLGLVKDKPKKPADKPTPSTSATPAPTQPKAPGAPQPALTAPAQPSSPKASTTSGGGPKRSKPKSSLAFTGVDARVLGMTALLALIGGGILSIKRRRKHDAD